MMISDILKSNGIYNDRDIQLFADKIKFRRIAKDEILIKQGQVCRSVFFIIEGAFYQYNFKNEIEENVLDLHSDNEWFLNYNSFISQKPSDSFIKAYTDSKIFELDIESLHWLIGESPGFLQLLKILEPATARVHFFDNRLTPVEKYKYVFDNRRELIKKFPLKFIASYLKITPETLSRVRESFLNEK